ncbi:MAG: exodeoxyribonuclease VII small subunit [Bacteroidales bacterium]|nr:exodeoxyribonuclease VII small subunit [Bacteroidales bacterium]
MAVKKTVAETAGVKAAGTSGAKSGTAGTKPGHPDGMSYTKAFKELQKIVEELENEEVEIDALVTRLQRAGVLLQICKSRLSATEAETEKLLAEIVG